MDAAEKTWAEGRVPSIWQGSLWLYLGKSRLDGVPVHVQLYTAEVYPGQDAEVSFFSLCMDVILHMHSIAEPLISDHLIPTHLKDKLPYREGQGEKKRNCPPFPSTFINWDVTPEKQNSRPNLPWGPKGFLG